VKTLGTGRSGQQEHQQEDEFRLFHIVSVLEADNRPVQ
jgi:hypothetical protein